MDIVIIDGLSFALPLFIMAIGGIYCEKSGVTMSVSYTHLTLPTT